jgi:hypothetical protein
MDSLKNVKQYSNETEESNLNNLLKSKVNLQLGCGFEDVIFQLFSKKLYTGENKEAYLRTIIEKRDLILYNKVSPQLDYYSKLLDIKRFMEDNDTSSLQKNSVSNEELKSQITTSSNFSDLSSSNSKESVKKSVNKSIPHQTRVKPNNSYESIKEMKSPLLKETEIEIDCAFWNVKGASLKKVLMEQFKYEVCINDIHDEKYYVLITEICLNLKNSWKKKLPQLAKLTALIIGLKELHTSENFILLLISNSEYENFTTGLKNMEQKLQNFSKIIKDQNILFYPIFYNLNNILAQIKNEELESRLKENEAKIQALQEQISILMKNRPKESDK